jgi:hypothetical protein
MPQGRMTPCGIFVPKNQKAAREYFLAAFLCLHLEYVWNKLEKKGLAAVTNL